MTLLDCEIHGRPLMDHDLKASPGEPRCQMPVSEEDDPTEGEHRGCPPVDEDACTCHGYQALQVFPYNQVIKLLKLPGATITLAQPTDPQITSERHSHVHPLRLSPPGSRSR
jgi:hypothetical protein